MISHKRCFLKYQLWVEIDKLCTDITFDIFGYLQVSQHCFLDLTLLCKNQLRNLAQICAKNYYLHSPRGVLCSKMVIYSFFALIWRKNVHFSAKFVIAFLTTFPHCAQHAKISWNHSFLFCEMISRNKPELPLFWQKLRESNCFILEVIY